MHAVAYDLGERCPHPLRSRFGVPGVELCVTEGDAACGGDQDVARTAGGVDEPQVEETARVGRREAVYDRVECLVEEFLDDADGRVVGARRLALVAREGLEPEPFRLGAAPGPQFQQGLVDAAEFVGAEVAVVDALPAAIRVLYLAQQPYGLQEAVVGQPGGTQRFDRAEPGGGSVALVPDVPDVPEVQAAEFGQGESGCPAVGAEGVEHSAQSGPQVGVAVPGAAEGDTAQASGGEVGHVPLTGARHLLGLLRVEENASVLGHEQEDQLVGKAQQFVVELLQGLLAAACDGVPQMLVGVQEAGAEHSEGVGDLVTEVVAGAQAGLDGVGAQPLDAAVGRGEGGGVGIPDLVERRLRGPADRVAAGVVPALVLLVVSFVALGRLRRLRFFVGVAVRFLPRAPNGPPTNAFARLGHQLEAGGVQQGVQENEVGVLVVVEDRFEIELQIRGADEGGGIPEDA